MFYFNKYFNGDFLVLIYTINLMNLAFKRKQNIPDFKIDLILMFCFAMTVKKFF